ncbi:MAG: hypothetical protein KDC23_00590 [Actinobacteria bacterium]|nr:hypothetical protein [Actinomycetota bacterium]
MAETTTPGGPEPQATGALGKFNLAVVGAAGAGKTTLVDAVFSAMVPDVDRAPGGSARSWPNMDAELAECFIARRDPDGIVTVVESASINDPVVLRRVVAVLVSRARESGAAPLNERLHAVWWVADADSEITAPVSTAIAAIAEVVPVLAVMTRVPATLAGQPNQEVVRRARFLESQLLPVSQNRVFLTNARADATTGSPVHGLAELREATFQAAPEAARRAQAAALAKRRSRTSERTSDEPLTATLRARLSQFEAESRPLRAALRSGWNRINPQRWR